MRSLARLTNAAGVQLLVQARFPAAGEKLQFQQTLFDQRIHERGEIAGRLQSLAVAEIENVGNQDVVRIWIDAGDFSDLRDRPSAAGQTRNVDD